jgi:hypothetical protein
MSNAQEFGPPCETLAVSSVAQSTFPLITSSLEEEVLHGLRTSYLSALVCLALTNGIDEDI